MNIATEFLSELYGSNYVDMGKSECMRDREQSQLGLNIKNSYLKAQRARERMMRVSLEEANLSCKGHEYFTCERSTEDEV